MDTDEIIRASEAACEALSHEDDGLKREVLGHAGNRWSMGIVHALGANGAMRHATLRRHMGSVTQRMLTRTLRQLERDGLITRHVHAEVPPRVEYDLTHLGRGLLARMVPLWTWVIEHGPEFRAARSRFDDSPPAAGP